MSILSSIWKKFLTIFGDIKVSKYPCWIMYDPEYFKMPGDQLLHIVRSIQPGDVILRGYDCYADGYLIPKVEGHGRYSHAGLYVGNDQVIHSVAPNVIKTHVLEFMECDRIAILRPCSHQELAINKAYEYLDKKVPYDFGFIGGDDALYCYELCAECYKALSIPKKDASILCGLAKRKNCFLASSFFESKDFQLVYELNPNKNICINALT